MKNQETEIWKAVPGYEGHYDVSDLGRVKSLERTTLRRGHVHKVRERILAKSSRIKGKPDYETVVLRKEGKSKSFPVHHLVAMAFMNHTPNGYTKVIDHKNDIKNDNRLSNLQILTHRQNVSKKKYRGNTNSVGVHWCKTNKKYISLIQRDGKIFMIGRFDTEKEASKHYKDAVRAIEKGKEIKLIRKKRSSKYKGVTWHKREGKWRVQIKENGKQKQIGSYKTELEAHEAYVEYSKNLKNERF